VQLQESRSAAFERVTSDPLIMLQVVDHITTGGTLIELCETWGVPYLAFYRWIKADMSRTSLYEEAKEERAAWVEERILKELRLIAIANPADAFNSDQTVKPLDQMPEATQRVIQEITVNELWETNENGRQQVGEVKRIKFYSKTEAIQLAAKNLGLLIDRKELSITRKLEDIVAIEAEEIKP
jgi:hypothetical protein